MSDANKNNSIQIYQTKSGALEVNIDDKLNTVWLNQTQISKIFDLDQSVVSRHINKTFKDQEVDKNSNMQKMHIANSDKPVNYYSLDVVLSVGYKTNSANAIKFRKWANSVLSKYINNGYVLNNKFLKNHKEQIQEIKQTLELIVQSKLADKDQILGILEQYTKSLIVLNQFDEDKIIIDPSKKSYGIEVSELRQLIKTTKECLIKRGEASELFGKEVDAKFQGALGAIYQTFDGKDVYPSLEEKASNLLYLVIKNHGFVDGNKRIGSILFVYFLAKHQFLYNPNGQLKISENSLVSLALLIAQSNPKDKALIIKLVIKMLENTTSARPTKNLTN
jgi:prophage maintenance system killer protein/predicted XRE-type DNA-binding protein